MIFKDKTVIVTGASDGVGAAAARRFAEAGANLMLVARGKKRLEEFAEQLRDKTRVEICAMDVADKGACVNLLKKANFEFGRVDILVNNAGYHARGNVMDVDAEDLATMIEVNLGAPIYLTRITLPYLLENGSGAIVNVGSLAGRTPVPGSATYAASKAGLRSFTYALADELHDTDIKLATVSPGPISTGFILAKIDETSDLTFSQPMSSADEVAQAILDLCGNRPIELSMPAISGLLTTISYLSPWLARKVRPLLIRRGARAKKAWKARQKEAQKSSS